MTNFRFEKNRRSVKECPCGKSNKDGKFSPLVGYEDKGKCFSCGKFFKPEASFVRNASNTQKATSNNHFALGNHSHIPFQIVKDSLTNYGKNKFVAFLIELVGREAAKKAIRTYLIGTAEYWQNYGTIFWQISNDVNRERRVRTGKIIEYNIVKSEPSFIGKDCKRNKAKNLPPVTWVHKNRRFENFALNQCLFGEHLLDDSQKPVAITESEKSAIIASLYLPEFTWLASGGLSNLTYGRCKVLQGRKVILFPDLNGYEAWTTKAEELSSLCKVKVSDLLDKKASLEDRRLGLDIADYLIKMDYKQFFI